jgi:hypothetical protein
VKRPLLLQAITSADRHQVVAAVNDSLSARAGWVVDAHFFSNKAATIRFTIPRMALQAWLDDLAAARLRLDPTPLPEIGDEIAGSLSITFLHDEPDLVRDIPAVPG